MSLSTAHIFAGLKNNGRLLTEEEKALWAPYKTFQWPGEAVLSAKIKSVEILNPKRRLRF